MKKINLRFIGILVIVITTSCHTKLQTSIEDLPRVSVGSLLEEMTSRKAIPQLPGIAYKTLQASSYDRRTIGYDQGWHANGDRSNFVNVEQREDGKFEHVLLDVKGPGSIVRFWAVTSSSDLLEGTLRFYMNGDSGATFVGSVEDLIGGDFFASYPLSMTVAHESERIKQGRNLYMPIPFEKSIKVTYEKKDGKRLVNGEAAWPADALFYNINYRIYIEDVQVETLTLERLKAARKLIEVKQEKLQVASIDTQKSKNRDLSCTIPPKGKKVFDLKSYSEKGGAIQRLTLKLKAKNLQQALRSTILEIAFDGERTVWVPVGDFFGTGYQLRETNSWYGSTNENGLMTALWIMPFEKSCTITLHNLRKQEVILEQGEVFIKNWEWNEHSMHFGSAWHQYTKINSKPDRDLNYVSLEGQGVYVGDVLTLFDSHKEWWGEGDEKIFVDGDEFPSHFGTGTEDYYGYAWCLGARFLTPFISQPDGTGNLDTGYTVNSRYRLLDGIPFSKDFRFDMELQHWKEARLNYAPTVYWYARPGVKCNIQPTPQAAKYPVALTIEDVE